MTVNEDDPILKRMLQTIETLRVEQLRLTEQVSCKRKGGGETD